MWEGGSWRPQPLGAGGQAQEVKPKWWELGAQTPGSKGRGARDPACAFSTKARIVLSHQAVWQLRIRDFWGLAGEEWGQHSWFLVRENLKLQPEIPMCAKASGTPVFSKEAGSGFMDFIGVGKAEQQDAGLLGVGWPGTCTPGSSAKDRMGFQWILGHRDRGSGTSAGYLVAAHQRAPGKWGHHPIPFRAHTYLGPDTVCGSEAGGLWREEGDGRRKVGRERPGAWPGRRRASCSWQDTRAHPLTHPVQAGGQAACSLSRASCLLPASTVPRTRVLGLGVSQPAGTRQPCPQIHLPPSPACAHPTLGTIAILAALSVCALPPFTNSPHFAHTCSLL